VRLVKLASPG